MWGRRIDFNYRNNNVIPENSDKVHRLEQLDTKFAYSKAFKKPLLNFTNYFDHILRRLEKNKKFSKDRVRQAELLSDLEDDHAQVDDLFETDLKANQKSNRKVWFYLNILGLIFFLVVVVVAINYSYQKYDNFKDVELGILGR